MNEKTKVRVASSRKRNSQTLSCPYLHSCPRPVRGSTVRNDYPWYATFLPHSKERRNETRTFPLLLPAFVLVSLVLSAATGTPSEICSNNLAIVEPRMPGQIWLLLQMRQKRFSSRRPVSSLKIVVLVVYTSSNQVSKTFDKLKED